MKRPNQITATVLILFSAFMAREALDMTYYTPLGPGPGFFPFWISIFIGLLSAIMLYQATFHQSDPMPEDFLPSKAGYFRVIAVTFGMIFVVVIMPILGFQLTMLPFLLFMLYALGRQNLLVTTLVALAGSFGVFYVFNNWLQVPLPIGMFGI